MSTLDIDNYTENFNGYDNAEGDMVGTPNPTSSSTASTQKTEVKAEAKKTESTDTFLNKLKGVTDKYTPGGLIAGAVQKNAAAKTTKDGKVLFGGTKSAKSGIKAVINVAIFGALAYVCFAYADKFSNGNENVKLGIQIGGGIFGLMALTGAADAIG